MQLTSLSKAKVDVNADSIYAGGLDALGQPYVTRVFWSHQMQVRCLVGIIFSIADCPSRKVLLTYLLAISLRVKD